MSNKAKATKTEKPTKDEQVMTRMTTETKDALEAIALEIDRSVSWILNNLAVKFIAQHQAAKKASK